MQKFVTRTFHVVEGEKLIPDFTTATFQREHVTLIDPEQVPSDVTIQEEHDVKARMPLETFYANSEKLNLN